MTVKSLRKQLAAAIAMTLVATVALGSSTYAWFTMNTVVSANNMEVRAKAEKGLLINEIADYSDAHWDDEATANQTSSNPCLLYPASTEDGSAWYHGASKKSYDSASAASGSASSNLINGTYTTLSGLTAITDMSVGATAGTTAARSTMGSAADADAGYYVKYTYYLKSSSDQVTLNTTAGSMNVYIKSVTATAGSSNSTALNSSLRVGILMKTGGTFYIYAPVSGFTNSYYVNAGTTATEPIAGNVATKTDLTTLPAVGTDGAAVEVYIWYEGEDAACKSDNATASLLDNIDIDIEFELKEVPQA